MRSERMMRAIASAAVCAASAGLAWAAGPDVIVGDLPNITNWTSSGAIGGVRAYSVGTTSCNIGTLQLTWISSTNQHPVISGNAYRLLNGRFEQIGQSWLKHGFTALQGTVCASCPSPWPNGTALAVGCSDPYSSGLNGDQTRLGAKSEVNAYTGNFPYPYVLQGTGDATLKKRLQVLDADLDPATGLYFVSSMYVQPEDATTANGLNNESYRKITIGAAPAKDWTLQSTTQRGRAAIFAWQDNEAGVFTSAADVTGEGRFYIASKATSLGGGQWHYEYAVENINSDRGGQSFSVPLPAGAVVTNIGFHDVPYHSGEPYSGTDWTSAVTSSAITWSTQTFAQNANANALRWDTLYNFRFDCNIPPAGGQATIGLFKTGSPTSASGTAAVPSGDGTQHPINDTCANSITLPVGTTSTAFDTTGAATDGPIACVASSYDNIGADIWYRWTNSACAGTAIVSTCGSSFDTKIAVYNDGCMPAANSHLACNDDFACGTGTLQSQTTFTAAPGVTYLIRVGGYKPTTGNPLTGTGTLAITAPGGCGPQPPANDACVTAIWIADNTPVNGDTTLATNDGTATCGSSATSADVWYKYRPATSASVNVNTCGSSLDTVVTVFTGACGALTEVACNDDSYNGGNNACGTGNLGSGINVAMTGGTTYYIRVAGFNSLVGTFTLKAIGGGGVAPPANDDCANRAGISLGDTPFTTSGATTDGVATPTCAQVDNDVWYNYPANQTGQLVVSTCGAATFNTKLAVYSGSGCTNFPARFMACNDDGAGCTGGRSKVTVPVTAGTSYTIRVGGASGASGSGTLNLTFVPPCVADVDDGSGTGTPDGGVTIDDLLYYLQIFDAGLPRADVDDGTFTGTHDGGVTIDDLLYYLFRFDAGC